MKIYDSWGSHEEPTNSVVMNVAASSCVAIVMIGAVLLYTFPSLRNPPYLDIMLIGGGAVTILGGIAWVLLLFIEDWAEVGFRYFWVEIMVVIIFLASALIFPNFWNFGHGGVGVAGSGGNHFSSHTYYRRGAGQLVFALMYGAVALYRLAKAFVSPPPREHPLSDAEFHKELDSRESGL